LEKGKRKEGKGLVLGKTKPAAAFPAQAALGARFVTASVQPVVSQQALRL